MREVWRNTVLVLIIIVLLGLGIFMIVKPQQEQLTQEILNQKLENSSEYLDFIADNLVGGGPPKDGIPAIDGGILLSAEEAGLSDEDTVFGINYGGKVIAYPKNIMYWHEIVNDVTEDGQKISVTYCPLTESIIGYLDVDLGVSGALYNSNLVMYDRATDSIYPQMLGQAVDNSDKGRVLETFDVDVTTWGQWKSVHPDTKVLSRDTVYARAYDNPPYQGYQDAYTLWFPVAAKSDQFHTKKIIHGIEYDGVSLAVVKENIGDGLTYETPNDILTITYDSSLDVVRVSSNSGKEVKNYDSYWFAWYAYHPETNVLE